jgi:hypothetical protein
LPQTILLSVVPVLLALILALISKKSLRFKIPVRKPVILLMVLAIIIYLSLSKIPHIKQILYPSILLFYMPTILLGTLALVNFRKGHKFVRSWLLAIGLSMLLSLNILKQMPPIYRHFGILIPPLAILAAPFYKIHFGRYLLTGLIISLALTVYPSPVFTYGRDVQYYPYEYEALKRLANQSPKPILTDARIRSMAYYITRFPWSWKTIPNPSEPPPFDSYVFISRTIVEYGAVDYGEGLSPEQRLAVKIDLKAFMSSKYYELIYEDDDRVWIFTAKTEH